MSRSLAKTPKKKKISRDTQDDDLEEWKRSKQLQKPKDQIELTEAELKELVPRQLVLTNPQLPQNIIEFSYAEGAFISVSQQTNYTIAYETKGTYIHRNSEEAREQLIAQGIDPATLDVDDDDEDESLVEGTLLTDDEGIGGEGEGVGEEAEVEEEEEDEGEDEGGEGKPRDSKADEGPQADDYGDDIKPTAGKKLTNQFNYCDRAALSYNLPVRCQETQTTPPPIQTFAANVLQWIIYDAYLLDYAEQMAEKERERERKEREKAPISKQAPPAASGALASKKRRGGKHKMGGKLSAEVRGRVFQCWKVLERMINLNTYDEIAKDYRYWEDPSDEYREDEGTLLPLWKYTYDKCKKHTVTYLMWNPWYYDLFVACFGYLDFMKPLSEGYICLFTIKNPSFPETVCSTDSAIMCADIHPKYPYMLVCGLYNGNIHVYNIQANAKRPAFITRSYDDKHTGIIWAIKWVPDLPDGELNFFSVSNDGKVNNYVLMQNELSLTTIINLYLEKEAAPGPDGTQVKMKGCATYITLHPKNPKIYLVGTEEGLIYKCSVNYSARYLLTYYAHHMPVYKINYNNFNTDIFVSCSGDWRIKIWEDKRMEPLFVFDMGASVMDVEWAPYSSTVFACVSIEGKVHVFDLNINKYKPICVQAVVSKKRNKLTTIAFNYNLPILIVGDDKGTVTALKLSPNLRIPCKAPKKQQHLDQWTMQCMKLDKLLSLVREPPVLAYKMEVTSNVT